MTTEFCATRESLPDAFSADRIDAHHHLWDLDVRPQSWTARFPELQRSFAFEHLRPALEKAGIEATVVVQTAPLLQETRELLELASRIRQIRGVVGWVDLQREDVADQVSALRAGPGGHLLVGIRHGVQDEPDPRFLARPAVRHGLSMLAELDLTYDMLVRGPQLQAVIDVAAALPSLRIVLDHFGKPDLRRGVSNAWRRHMTELATHPSVAVKLSGLVTEAGPGWTLTDLRPAVQHVLQAFGPTRIIMGSDWPACLPAANYQRVIDAERELILACSPGERARIEGGTATQWYRLGGRSRPPGTAADGSP